LTSSLFLRNNLKKDFKKTSKRPQKDLKKSSKRPKKPSESPQKDPKKTSKRSQKDFDPSVQVNFRCLDCLEIGFLLLSSSLIKFIFTVK
jgi:hypothetical protein